jgi:hypothetical protein
MVGVLAVVLAEVVGADNAGAQDGLESIKAIMNKPHKGADWPLGTLKAQLNVALPDWARFRTRPRTS